MADYPPRAGGHHESTDSGLTDGSDLGGHPKFRERLRLSPAAASIIVAIIGLVGTIAVAYINLKPGTPPNPAPAASTSPARTGAASTAQTVPATATSAAVGGTTSPPTSAQISSPLAAGSPVTGDWNVTYAAPATVTITLAGGIYTESAKTRVLVFPGTSCYIQPGIAIATFTKTGPGTYAGHARLWSENTCITNATTSMTVALSSGGNTLTETLKQATPGTLSTVILTRTS
jgi:hypothetical protein